VELRHYQTQSIQRLRNLIRNDIRKIILVLPTGAGKTVVASSMIHSMLAKDKQALFLAHRKELIDQCCEKLARWGVPYSVIKADDKRYDPGKPVQVASIQTLIRRKVWPHADVIFIDECHRSVSRSYRKIIDFYREANNPPVIGLTATPYRADGRGLGELYEDLVVSTSTRQLCDDGYLVEPRVFCASHVELDGVQMRGAEFDEDALDELMREVILKGDIVRQWQSKANGAKTVVFCVNVRHSKAVAEQFIAAGSPAAHLDAKSNDADREKILNDLAEGRLMVVTNVGILTEGWDLPGLECVTLARPTASRSLYRQMIGRVMRPDESKRFAIVLDHAGCTVRHGKVTEDEDYNLNGVRRRGKGGKAQEQLNVPFPCPQCLLFVEQKTTVCPECGYEFPKIEAKVVVEDVDLEEITLRNPQVVYRNLCMTAIRNGYKAGWVAVRFKDEFGRWPRDLEKPPEFIEYEKAEVLSKDPEQEFHKFCQVCIEKKYNPRWVSVRFKEMFGRWPEFAASDEFKTYQSEFMKTKSEEQEYSEEQQNNAASDGDRQDQDQFLSEQEKAQEQDLLMHSAI
jgi:superfamily II DNA or RNA helicase